MIWVVLACILAALLLLSLVRVGVRADYGDGGLTVYNELIDWMLRNGMIVVGSDPLPVLNARFPGDWEGDEKGVRALDGMAERIVETLFR